MKFDHVVKHNGVYYEAGEDVPIEVKEERKAVVQTAAPLPEEKKVEPVQAHEQVKENPQKRGRRRRE